MKLKAWFSRQTDTIKGFIIVAVLLILGIIIRWSAVVEGVKKGFEFFNN